MTECHRVHYDDQLLGDAFYPFHPFLGGKTSNSVKILSEPFIGVEYYFITGTDI